jgi:zinc transport system substrate-binding protein
MKTTVSALLATTIITITASARAAEAPLKVAVSVLPQVEVVEHVGGGLVEVLTLVPPGAFPATYEPSPKQLASLIDAALWIQIGIPFERAITERLKAAAPDLPIIDGCAGIERHPLDAVGHNAHSEGALDPHIWLDPTLMASHAAILSRALCREIPEQCSVFDDNLTAYLARLKAADLRVASLLSRHRGSPLFVFHPAYGYLARRYGLIQVAVEFDGKVPTGRRLAELVERARVSGAHALFVQPQFAGGGAHAAAAAMGLEVQVIDPLAPDLTTNLERIAEAIAQSLREP